MKKNPFFTKHPIRATAVFAAVLALIIIPATAFGAVYYYANHTDNGYTVTASNDLAPVKLDQQVLEELPQYLLRFEEATVNMRDIGKNFDSHHALDAWLGGILLTSPMLDGESVLFCTDDNTGVPIAVHISGINTVTDMKTTCAVNITIPLVTHGGAFDWMTKSTDMLDSQTITAENGISAVLVTTETSVTAYFAHNGILYRMSISGDSAKAAEILTNIIDTMQ